MARGRDLMKSNVYSKFLTVLIFCTMIKFDYAHWAIPLDVLTPSFAVKIHIYEFVFDGGKRT